jgi:membrane protease YdiL (CAAX protease family)
LGGVVVLVIGATGFGMLMAGVMVYSGTIWIPIAVHGLYNFRWCSFQALEMASLPISEATIAPTTPMMK